MKNTNKELLKKSIKNLNKNKSVKVGEYLKYKGKYVRFTHDWGESLQTGDSGSFYLSEHGFMSFSGGLNSGVDKNKIELTKEKREGDIWFFNGGLFGANRGIDFKIPLRVWKVKKGIILRDYDVLGYDIKEEKEKITKEKITRFNGNGHKYISNIPTLIYRGELNEIQLKHILENTGLQFKKGFSDCYKVQPQTSNQIVTLLLTYNLRTQYHDNATNKNTLYLKGCSDSDFNY